jgi:hypothetical protein
VRDPGIRRGAILLGGLAVSFFGSSSLAAGDPRLALLVLLVLAGSLVLFAPTAAAVALFAVVSFASPVFGLVRFLGVNLTLAEILATALVGWWVVTSFLRPAPTGLARPMVAGVSCVVAGGVIGAVVGYAGLDGRDREPVTAMTKVLVFYLAWLPLAALVRERGWRWLEGWVLRIALSGCALTLWLAATGALAGAGSARSGRSVLTLDVVSEAQRIRLPVLPFVFVAALIVVRRIVHEAPTAARWAALAVIAVVEAISFNRSTWVPLALTCVAFLVLRPGERQPLRGLRTGLVGGGVAVLVLLAAGAGALGPTAKAATLRLSSVSPDVVQDDSYRYRQEETAAGLRAIAHSPVVGVGLGTSYGVRDSVYDRTTGGRTYFDRLFIHNSLVGAWLRFGLLGLIGFVVITWALLSVARAARGSADPVAGGVELVGALSFLGLGVQSLFQTSLFNRPTIVAAGCCLALVAASTNASGRASGPAMAAAEAAPRGSAATAGAAR